ncbi:MAG: helix-turn-helix domain-containing protein, partial [Clostridia bacterium]
MGRTARSNRENHERLVQLVDGATELFSLRGYGETTMADVAAHLQVAPGTLYLYFSGKEALFHLLVLRGLSESWDQSVDEIPVPSPDTEDIVECMRRRISRLVSASPVSWPPRDGPKDP